MFKLLKQEDALKGKDWLILRAFNVKRKSIIFMLAGTLIGIEIKNTSFTII